MRSGHWAVLLPLLFAHHVAPVAGAANADRETITVELLGLEGPTLNTITPTVSIRAQRSPEDSPIVALGVRASLSSFVLDQFVLDTFVLASDSAAIRLAKPLPSGATLYFRTYARTAQGDVVLSPASSARNVPRWLALIFPNAPAGAILGDKSPEFIWSSAKVVTPPGPWVYEFIVTRTAGGPAVFGAAIADTTITIPFPLEFNTSYRWTVTARLTERPTDRAVGSSSFVVVDESRPRVTVLFQTFPNPFPSDIAQFACIWFDLAERTSVRIDVLDIRTNLVRRIYPRPGFAEVLDPGRYGRAVNSESGCTQQFIRDGTDDSGRRLIPGVYLLRMRAGNREFVKRMVFRG